MNEYSLMETPFEYIPPNERNKKQTKQYFDWFLTQIDTRIEILQNYIDKTSTKKIVLDKSPESLIDLWEWFEDKIVEEKMTDEEIEKMLAGKNRFERDVLKDTNTKLSTLTLALALDISTYFGETMIHNNPVIYWGYETKPKMLIGVNQPTLLGFEHGKLSLDQRNAVMVCIRRSIRKRNKMELFETYEINERHVKE